MYTNINTQDIILWLGDIWEGEFLFYFLATMF